jgi:hypothetical protein
MIVKVGSQYEVRSEGGKRLGTYKTRAAAQKRLAQIEAFKHMKKRGAK